MARSRRQFAGREHPAWLSLLLLEERRPRFCGGQRRGTQRTRAIHQSRARRAGIKRAPRRSRASNHGGSRAMTIETTRRGALKCLGVGTGTLFTISGGIFSAIDLADAAVRADTGTPLFVQISDSHIGFNKD